jgi:hypothetical protein
MGQKNGKGDVANKTYCSPGAPAGKTLIDASWNQFQMLYPNQPSRCRLPPVPTQAQYARSRFG